jgi:hypothetical protein
MYVVCYLFIAWKISILNSTNFDIFKGGIFKNILKHLCFLKYTHCFDDSTAMFPLRPKTLHRSGDLNPGSSVLEADAMTTTLRRRQGERRDFFSFLFFIFHFFFHFYVCRVRNLSTSKYIDTLLLIVWEYFHNSQSCLWPALAAWRSGHRIRLRNKKTRVWILPGYKVFRETQQCCCV